MIEVVRLYGTALVMGGHNPPRREFGVPPGGPFDREAAALANALLGNSASAPVVEVAGTIKVRAVDAQSLATVGAGWGDCVRNLVPGQIVSLSPRLRHPQFVLAMPGGVREEAGGFSGQDSSIRVERRLADPPSVASPATLRFIADEQADASWVAWIESREFRTSKSSNRMGIRLEGEPLPHAIERPSEPQCQGAIQLPPGGLPIILGPDGPTIGGYPKVGVVIDADLDIVGRLAPGHPVRFRAVTLDDAIAAGARRDAQMRHAVAELLLARS